MCLNTVCSVTKFTQSDNALTLTFLSSLCISMFDLDPNLCSFRGVLNRKPALFWNYINAMSYPIVARGFRMCFNRVDSRQTLLLRHMQPGCTLAFSLNMVIYCNNGPMFMTHSPGFNPQSAFSTIEWTYSNLRLLTSTGGYSWFVLE